LVYEKSEMVKTLKCSLGYFSETNDYNFICSIWQNLFHNDGFYSLILTELKEEFLVKITSNIIEAYNYKDPSVKALVLEIYALLFNFKIPSIAHENYLKLYLAEYYKAVTDKVAYNDNDIYELFISTLYKDFKVFDFEEYELQFLAAVNSMLTYEPLYKKAVNYLDLDLYLLNRRVKKNEICELKYEVVKQIVTNPNSGEIDKNLFVQFTKYINKGIY
jgi:hypothetical protein